MKPLPDNHSATRGLEHNEVMSGTNDTSHLSEPSQASRCPCGRYHPSTAPWRRPSRPGLIDPAELAKKVYPAQVAGKVSSAPDGTKIVAYHGDCERPIGIRQMANRGALVVQYDVRCRKCAPCLAAKVRYWAAAGAHQTSLAFEQGKRTWFGTLTFSAEHQASLLAQARESWLVENSQSSHIPTWWEDPSCDHRFALVRPMVVKELQKYWKRLRKAGHQFNYFVAIERHASGLPHVHWLLHENAAPIRKRHLQMQWPFGFTKILLVGGKSKRSAPAAKAAFYVAKYLGKNAQARQIASKGYKPSKKSKVSAQR